MTRAGLQLGPGWIQPFLTASCSRLITWPRASAFRMGDPTCCTARAAAYLGGRSKERKSAYIPISPSGLENDVSSECETGEYAYLRGALTHSIPLA
jgi:hypothetical protein